LDTCTESQAGGRGRAGIFARKLHGGHNTLPRDYVRIPQVLYGAGWVPCRSLDAPIVRELRRRFNSYEVIVEAITKVRAGGESLRVVDAGKRAGQL
jgi:hypothetical protein